MPLPIGLSNNAPPPIMRFVSHAKKYIFLTQKRMRMHYWEYGAKKMRSEPITEMLKGLTHLNPRRHRGVDATPSGFPRITRERIGRSSRNLVYLTVEQFHTFPENFKSVPTMTFDLWPDFRGHVRRNLRSVPFQRLKLANFGMFAGDMDMDRCWEVISVVRTDAVTFPRSS